MPIVIQDIERYIIYFKDGDLYIEEQIIHPQDKKKLKTREEKENIGISITKSV
tara:strand:+ start:2747 stop:2905 length:159 start_codon:yes stop_codon:yes gene_type:complete